MLRAKHQVKIWIDHKNLFYFKAPQDFNWRQAWWVTEFEDYGLKIIPKAGKKIKKANILLKQANYEKGENDNKNVTLLKPE